MAPKDELDYLKSLVAQLNTKIDALEQKAKAAVGAATPAQQLRTILIGPPGAGAFVYAVCASATRPAGC
jgi:adenylate kinase